MDGKKILLLKSEMKHLEKFLEDLDEIEAGKKKFVLENDVCKAAATLMGKNMSSRFQRLKVRIKPNCTLCEETGTKERCDYVVHIMYRIHDYSNVDEIYLSYVNKFRRLFQSDIKDIEREISELE